MMKVDHTLIIVNKEVVVNETLGSIKTCKRKQRQDKTSSKTRQESRLKT